MRFPELHYFQCRNCRSVLVVTVKGPRPERCRADGSWMTFLYTVPVETDEQRALHARGTAWNPHAPTPEPWTCVRCGEAQAASGLSKDRPDGRVCLNCYRAEEHPPLLTPGEIDQRQAARTASRDALLDAQERAYQELEQR